MLTVENLKILLELEDDSKNELLELIIKKITTAILEELRLDCLNKKLEAIALDLCVLQYHKVVTYGQGSEIPGDISVTASDVGAVYKSII